MTIPIDINNLKDNSLLLQKRIKDKDAKNELDSDWNLLITKKAKIKAKLWIQITNVIIVLLYVIFQIYLVGFSSLSA